MKCLLAAVTLSLTSFLSAQNLVPNPSFEEYTTCPPSFGYWDVVADWECYYTFSADYFNTCSSNDVSGVPLNSFGYQLPAEGSGYMGMCTYLQDSPTYRELIGAPLTEPLQPGVPVFLCFKVAVGGFGSWNGNSANYSCKGIGMNFFVDLPSNWQTYLYPNSAALYLDEVPTDTSTWYTVSGTYVPDSAYTHLVIGNFFSDALSQPAFIDTLFGISYAAYAFVDDVRVTYDPDFCSSASSIASALEAVPLIYPNPASDRITIERQENGAAEIRINDAQGRTMRTTHVIGKECSIALSGLAPGAYSIRVISATNDRSTRFIKR